MTKMSKAHNRTVAAVTITRTAATRTVAKKGIAGKTKMKIKQQNKKKGERRK